MASFWYSMQRLHDIKCVASEHSVDLLMHGFCFRLKVYYDRDFTLVQKRKTKADSLMETTHLPEKDTDFLHILGDDLMLNNLHASMLSGLQGRYPIYGPTVRCSFTVASIMRVVVSLRRNLKGFYDCRLAKRWIASHMFSDVIREEAVELLVAYVFLKPAPFATPLSRITGFLRYNMFHTGHSV